jgi:hypothetical protein
VTLLHKLGSLAALAQLGIIKTSAIGAKTMLPMAAKMPSMYSGGLKSLRGSGPKEIPRSLADAPEAMKYYQFMGKPGGAAETSTSRAFRKQITEEARPHLAMPRGGTIPAPRGPASTEALTVPPPGRK